MTICRPLDNDDLRRGRKTTHVVYGEAMGILVGDALLTEAFRGWRGRCAGVEPARQLRAIAEVATAVDSTGMIGGQVADIVAERSHEQSDDRDALLRELHFIHRNKTGKLFTASRAPRRAPRRRLRGAARGAAALRATRSGSPSRSSTICSTSRSPRRRWARPPGRTSRRES